jgi:hypothetical protein
MAAFACGSTTPSPASGEDAGNGGSGATASGSSGSSGTSSSSGTSGSSGTGGSSGTSSSSSASGSSGGGSSSGSSSGGSGSGSMIDGGAEGGPITVSAFTMDTPNVVRRANVVLAKANTAPQQFMALGDGALGMAVWAANGFTAQLNRTDTFPNRKAVG